LIFYTFILLISAFIFILFFFFNHTTTTVIYTLSLHDALPISTSTTSIDIMGLQAAYANLHTDQERDYFMQRYHDVITFLVSMQIDRKSGSAGMPRPISYAVFCLKKKNYYF